MTVYHVHPVSTVKNMGLHGQLEIVQKDISVLLVPILQHLTLLVI